MKVKTASGTVTINKSSHYGKWLQGWIDGRGWTGAQTLADAWENAKDNKKILGNNITWYGLGYAMSASL